MLFQNYKIRKENKKEGLSSMNKPIKILYFVDRMLRGGIQSLVIDWTKQFKTKNMKVDFLLLDDGKDYELEETLKELGCNVYKLNKIWIRQPFDFIKEGKALDLFFKEHNDYKVIHMHSSSKNYLVLKYAKKYGIPIRISHAHASDFQSESSIKKIVGNALKPQLVKYSTNFFACSKDAGEWLFGNKIVNSKKFSVIKNGVDYIRFKFNKENREQIRKEYNIKDKDILIGHIGRFTQVKNQNFIVDILFELLKYNINYKVMFIGEGVLENQIKEKVNKYGLSNNVIFAGYQSDVSKYLSAFDLFILPSLYEGLGLVLIEAQANGLPCIATQQTIPDDVKVSTNFSFIELDVNQWVKQITNTDIKRENNYDRLKDKGYLIEDSIEKLIEVYKK